ncbi:hypothetical protein BJX66DRAFT_128817 [Aspergillus keveii]|uniref:Uncharacterized protein n=1 Tax=Aspergillus keveii TaxID=714993 RepID=A0ABR4GCK2_9EURO
MSRLADCLDPHEFTMGGLGVCTGVCFVVCMNWLRVASFTYPNNGASALHVVFNQSGCYPRRASVHGQRVAYVSYIVGEICPEWKK